MTTITDRDVKTVLSALRIAIVSRRGETSDDIDKNAEIANDITRFERLAKQLERETGRATEPDPARAKGPRRV